jgi:hypothetical protein
MNSTHVKTIRTWDKPDKEVSCNCDLQRIHVVRNYKVKATHER